MLENCRWLLCVSRLSGCHPHTLDERSTFTYFQPLQVYSFVASSAYCFAVVYASYSLSCVAKSEMIVGCALQQINRYNRGLYLILTTLLSCLRHEEFERALASASKFDDSTRRHRSYADNIRTNRYTQWLVISAICVTWITYGMLAKLFVPQISLLSTAVQVTIRIVFSVEIAKFCFLYDALYRRFRCLNELCHGLDGVDIGVSRMYTGRFTISSLERLHGYLTDATNHLSSYYGPQLLSWTVCILVDIIAYNFTTLYGRNTVSQVCIQITMILFLSLQLIAISRFSDFTCNQANAFAVTLFSVKTSTFKHTETSLEAIELGIFLRAHPLRVNVCGLFNLTSQFTCSAFGVILMYIILASSIH